MNGKGVSAQQGYRVLHIIWLAMAISVGVYVMLARLISPAPTLDSDTSGFLAGAFILIGFAVIAVQLLLRSNIKDTRLFPRIMDLESWAMNPQQADRLREMPVQERGKELILQARVIFGVILWALADGIAVMGLVLSLLSADQRYVMGFGLAALANLLYFRPNRADYEEQVKRWWRYVEMKEGGFGAGTGG